MFNLKSTAFITTLAVSAIGLAAVSGPANADMSVKTDEAVDAKINVETDAELDFSNVDENSDGKVSQTEFSSSVDANTSAATFSELDTNKDGALNEAEFDVLASADTKAGMHNDK